MHRADAPAIQDHLLAFEIARQAGTEGRKGAQGRQDVPPGSRNPRAEAGLQEDDAGGGQDDAERFPQSEAALRLGGDVHRCVACVARRFACEGVR